MHTCRALLPFRCDHSEACIAPKVPVSLWDEPSVARWGRWFKNSLHGLSSPCNSRSLLFTSAGIIVSGSTSGRTQTKIVTLRPSRDEINKEGSAEKVQDSDRARSTTTSQVREMGASEGNGLCGEEGRRCGESLRTEEGETVT